MSDVTPRFALPLLAAGQAQKEVTHNEALILIDALAQPIVESAALATPPTSPVSGQAWLVAAAPTGAWAGHAGAIALWSEGGWRFVAPIEGMRVVARGTGLVLRRGAAAWESSAAISTPTGGGVVDSQARTAIASILAALQQGGIIAT